MQIGYIHINKSEQAKQILALRRADQGAIDELGIGSIRDAMAEKMFPGTSTLHQHAKYFALMPQVYQQVWEKARKLENVSLREVHRLIIEEEIRMTKYLSKNSPKASGITGADSLMRQNKFVKYDPTYIYNAALQTYGFINLGKSSTIASAITHAAKQWQNLPEKTKTDDENIANDANEASGIRQFCEFPKELGYKFPEECNLNVNLADREYIKSHILSTARLDKTLLKYLLENDKFKVNIPFEAIDCSNLPKEIGELVQQAKDISKFIYLLFIQYNVILSKGQDNDIQAEWEEVYQDFKANPINIADSLRSLKSIRNKLLLSSIDFVEQCYYCITRDDIASLAELIRDRERRIKGNRKKIDNPDFTYVKPIHHYSLTYRWETVQLFLKELRKENMYG